MMQYTVFSKNGEQVFQFHNHHTMDESSEFSLKRNLKCIYMLVHEPTESGEIEDENIVFVFFFSSVIEMISKDFHEVATFVKISLKEI